MKQKYIVFSVACMVAFLLFQSRGVATKAEGRDSSTQLKMMYTLFALPVINFGLRTWGLKKKRVPIPILIASVLLAGGGVGLYNYYNSGMWVGSNIRIDLLFILPLTCFNLLFGLHSGYDLMARFSNRPFLSFPPEK